MRLPQLEEFLDENLVLPLPGADGIVREYTVRPCDGKRWLRIMTLQQVVSEHAAGKPSTSGDLDNVQLMSQRSIIDDALGEDVVNAMFEDGVRAPLIRLAGTVATLYHMAGADAAQEAWLGKAQQLRTRSDKSGEEEGETKKADSTSGTNTLKKS